MPLPPPISSTGTPTLPAIRTTEVRDGTGVLARTLVHISAHPLAVMQILEIEVTPARRRQGLGSQLFAAAVADAQRLCAPGKLRRVYVNVPHKSAIEFRAFLTRVGFHHITTTKGVVRNEDLLTYVKSYT